MNNHAFVLAVENEQGHIDYSRNNFVRLNPDIPNTADNYCGWMRAVSQNRIYQANERAKFEPVDCSLFDKGIVE